MPYHFNYRKSLYSVTEYLQPVTGVSSLCEVTLKDFLPVRNVILSVYCYFHDRSSSPQTTATTLIIQEEIISAVIGGLLLEEQSCDNTAIITVILMNNYLGFVLPYGLQET